MYCDGDDDHYEYNDSHYIIVGIIAIFLMIYFIIMIKALHKENT